MNATATPADDSNNIDAIWLAALADAGEILGEIVARTAGNGPAIPDANRWGATDKQERRQAIQRERVSRYLGSASPDGWNAREEGEGVGVYDPSSITEEVADGMLARATAYVRRHSGPVSVRPLNPEQREEIVSRILFYVLTRDYTDSGITRGAHAKALGQAMALYKRTQWIGESAFARREAREAVRNGSREVVRNKGATAQAIGNPATIVQTMEEAERGECRGVPANNRGTRRRANRDRRTVKVGRMSPDAIRAVLTPPADAPQYAGHATAPAPQPVPAGASCVWFLGCRRDLQPTLNPAERYDVRTVETAGDDDVIVG
jgi:hypothetical protein